MMPPYIKLGTDRLRNANLDNMPKREVNLFHFLGTGAQQRAYYDYLKYLQRTIENETHKKDEY